MLQLYIILYYLRHENKDNIYIGFHTELSLYFIKMHG